MRGNRNPGCGIPAGRLSATLLVSAVLLCYSGDGAYAGDDHACDYLSRAEVEQILRTSAQPGEAQAANPLGQSICVFDIPRGGGLGLVQVQMMRSSWAKAAGAPFSADDLFANNMSFLNNLVEVHGLGEKAYWGGSGLKMGAGLHVLYQDAYFTVGVETGDSAERLEKARSIAGRILEKID